MELESKAETVYNNLNRDRSLRLLLLNIAIDISCYLIQDFFFGKRDLMMSAVGRIYGRWTVIAEAPTMGFTNTGCASVNVVQNASYEAAIYEEGSQSRAVVIEMKSAVKPRSVGLPPRYLTQNSAHRLPPQISPQIARLAAVIQQKTLSGQFLVCLIHLAKVFRPVLSILTRHLLVMLLTLAPLFLTKLTAFPTSFSVILTSFSLVL